MILTPNTMNIGVLSSTDENRFDLDSVGGVCYLRTNLVETIHVLSQTEASVTASVACTGRSSLGVCLKQVSEEKFRHNCNQIRHNRSTTTLTGMYETQLCFSPLYFDRNTSVTGHIYLAPRFFPALPRPRSKPFS